MTAVSGITPSGRLTLGNYLGALRRFAEQTQEPGFYFVADLHAMTTTHDQGRLATLTRQTALLFLASGLPDESVFIQSAVPAHVQLAYLLECTAHLGELSRMVQYKEKGRGKPMTRASLSTHASWPPIFCCTAPTGSPSAATKTSTWNWPATWRSGSTPPTVSRSSCPSSIVRHLPGAFEIF